MVTQYKYLCRLILRLADLELMSMLVLPGLGCCVQPPLGEGHLTYLSVIVIPEAPDTPTSIWAAPQPPNICYSHSSPTVSLGSYCVIRPRTVSPPLPGYKRMPATILQAVRTEAACQMHHRLPSLASGINTKKTHNGELRKQEVLLKAPNNPRCEHPHLLQRPPAPLQLRTSRCALDSEGPMMLWAGSWELGAERAGPAEAGELSCSILGTVSRPAAGRTSSRCVSAAGSG